MKTLNTSTNATIQKCAVNENQNTMIQFAFYEQSSFSLATKSRLLKKLLRPFLKIRKDNSVYCVQLRRYVATNYHFYLINSALD